MRQIGRFFISPCLFSDLYQKCTFFIREKFVLAAAASLASEMMEQEIAEPGCGRDDDEAFPRGISNAERWNYISQLHVLLQLLFGVYNIRFKFDQRLLQVRALAFTSDRWCCSDILERHASTASDDYIFAQSSVFTIPSVC